MTLQQSDVPAGGGLLPVRQRSPLMLMLVACRLWSGRCSCSVVVWEKVRLAAQTPDGGALTPLTPRWRAVTITADEEEKGHGRGEAAPPSRPGSVNQGCIRGNRPTFETLQQQQMRQRSSLLIPHGGNSVVTAVHEAEKNDSNVQQ